MSRIYVVHTKETQEKSLVRADTKAGALRHVAEKTMTAEVVSQDDLYDLASKGVKVEDAGKDEPEKAEPEAEKAPEEPLAGKKGKKDWTD